MASGLTRSVLEAQKGTGHKMQARLKVLSSEALNADLVFNYKVLLYFLLKNTNTVFVFSTHLQDELKAKQAALEKEGKTSKAHAQRVFALEQEATKLRDELSVSPLSTAQRCC